MSTTEIKTDTSQADLGQLCDLSLEVVTIPVSDVDRAKDFYQAWGGASTPTSSLEITTERSSSHQHTLAALLRSAMA